MKSNIDLDFFICCIGFFPLVVGMFYKLCSALELGLTETSSSVGFMTFPRNVLHRCVYTPSIFPCRSKDVGALKIHSPAYC